MKKLGILLAVILITCSLTTNVFSYSPNVNVHVNGTQVTFPDAKPFIDENNRTLIPVRFVSEALGSKVSWNGELRQVDITLGKIQVTLKINDSNIVVNNRIISMDTKAIIKQDRTFVPIRFVSEALGCNVGWDGATTTVFVTTKDKKTDIEPATEELKEIYENLENDYEVSVARAGGIMHNDNGIDKTENSNWTLGEGHVNGMDCEYAITIDKYDNEKAINDLEIVLKQFYPTKYKTVFNELKRIIEIDTIPSNPMDKIEEYENNFDGEDIEIVKWIDGIMVYIGG